MQILNAIQTISLTIFFGLIVWWIYTKRHQKSLPIKGKSLLIALAASLLISVISGTGYNAMSHSATNSKNDISSTNTTSSSKKESSTASTASSSNTAKSESSTENDVFQSLSTKELKEYNAGLIDSLSEEQQWASDGNDKYNTSLYIDNLKYDNNRGLLVYVSDEFNSLKKSDKTTVAKHAQSMANTQIVILGKDVDSESLPNTNVYYGSKKIGRSTMLSNDNNFKWYKS